MMRSLNFDHVFLSWLLIYSKKKKKKEILYVINAPMFQVYFVKTSETDKHFFLNKNHLNICCSVP